MICAKSQRKFVPVHTRHAVIEQDQVHASVLAKNPQRLIATARRHDRVSLRLQQVFSQF